MSKPLKGMGLKVGNDLKLEEIGFFDTGVKRIPDFFSAKNVNSAVKGLIKYHEDIIEDLVKKLSQWQATTIYKHIDNNSYPYPWIFILKRIQEEHQSINAIEHWLEDTI